MPMNEKILIVDDEKKMVGMLVTALEQEGYVTVPAYDGVEALERWRAERPDLVVLDILMPRMDGFEFCRKVRETSDTPIIILSARSEEFDKLDGLGLGADDYMTKPFSLRELVARIRALLRRRASACASVRPRVAAGPLVIDTERHSAEIDGRAVSLTSTEFDLLLALASDPERVFSRSRLIEALQGDSFEGYERTIDAHVGNIRKKLAEQAGDWSIIETVYGVGYRFKARKNA